MKAASRKNMMSISGMISTGERFRGMGEVIFIGCISRSAESASVPGPFGRP